MYGVAGERWLVERGVPWLGGYENSKPVRIGNAAADQLQLDIFGEVMDASHQARLGGLPHNAAAWEFGVDGPVDRWHRIRAEIHEEVCRRAFNTDLGSFAQAYDSNLWTRARC
jgi:GH15 family glucan-1,4-alpha-glucosidase